MDYVEWSRGAVINRGSFSTVSVGYVRHDSRWQLPPVVAVKTAPLPQAALLRHENSVLSDLQGCPNVVRFFGDQAAVDAATGAESYNLFLEYVAGGNLHDVVRRSHGGSLGEPTVRHYARSILRGLSSVHARGYAHCDIKPQNILVDAGSGDIKIADFGLAKRIEEDVTDCAIAAAGIHGTPLYMSPESAARSEHGAAADVWSVGCVVAEMASGRPPWRHAAEGDAWELLFRIGFGDELPEIPSELSEEGKYFLRRCFVKDPARRWTAEMLLQHPFMAVEEEQVDASAEKLNQWMWARYPFNSINMALYESVVVAPDLSVHPSPADRIKELATTQLPNWLDGG